jgi:hypothetical protein
MWCRTGLGRILIDNKTTEAFSYTVKQEDWQSLKRDAGGLTGMPSGASDRHTGLAAVRDGGGVLP